MLTQSTDTLKKTLPWLMITFGKPLRRDFFLCVSYLISIHFVRCIDLFLAFLSGTACWTVGHVQHWQVWKRLEAYGTFPSVHSRHYISSIGYTGKASVFPRYKLSSWKHIHYIQVCMHFCFERSVVGNSASNFA